MYCVVKTSLLLSLAFLCLCSALIHPADPFNSHDDANRVREALLEHNEEAITAILTRRSGVQRVAIVQAYNRTYSRNLVDDFYIRLSGNYLDLMVAMVTPLAEYYDRELIADDKHLKNQFYPSRAAADILLTSSNADLKTLKKAHRRLGLTPYTIPYMLSRSLSANSHQLSGNMIAGALYGKRDETQEVDVDAAIADAAFIHGTRLQNRLKTTNLEEEEKAIEKIFITRSHKQLRKIFQEFRKLSRYDIEQAFEYRGYKSDLLSGIQNMIPVVWSIPNYYATRLNAALRYAGTRDNALIRIVVGRSEIDLDEIKEAFQKNYGYSLSSAIADDTSGSYMLALLAIVDPIGPFNAKEDAKSLRQAITEHNEGAITALLTRRSHKERAAIDEAYLRAYRKYLASEFQSLLSGNYKVLMMAMVTPLSEYYAEELYKDARSSKTVVEILTTTSNAVLRGLNEAHKRVIRSFTTNSLEERIKYYDQGISRYMISAALNGERSEAQEVDVDAAIADAKLIYNNCELTPGYLRTFVQTRTIENIFIHRSYKQLPQIFEEYKKLYGHGIEKAFKGRGFKSDVEDGILNFIDIVKSIPKYYASRLYDTMHGSGTTDKDLIRIIVGRSDIDLGDIKKAFRWMYGYSLASMIEDDTSGNYRTALMAIVGSSEWLDRNYTNLNDKEEVSPSDVETKVPQFFSLEINHESF